MVVRIGFVNSVAGILYFGALPPFCYNFRCSFGLCLVVLVLLRVCCSLVFASCYLISGLGFGVVKFVAVVGCLMVV